jgi:hypothetical protein
MRLLGVTALYIRKCESHLTPMNSLKQPSK